MESNEQLYCFKMGSEADDTILNTNAGGCKPTPICMNHVGPKWQVEQIRGFYVYVYVRQWLKNQNLMMWQVILGIRLLT